MLNKSNLILGTPVARLPYEEKSQKKKKKTPLSPGKAGERFLSFQSPLPSPAGCPSSGSPALSLVDHPGGKKKIKINKINITLFK